MAGEMSKTDYPHYKPVGDQAVLAVFGDEVDLKINRRVHALDRLIEQKPFLGLVETVPTYTSLLVYYDLVETNYPNVLAAVQERAEMLEDALETPVRRVEIPTRYGGEAGPDLAFVAEHNGLSIEEVVRIHSGREYPVYMMGFTPGFPYMGGMDERIATPRLQSPRTHVPAGSVGVAGKQTGIYPIDSPGGWQIIGRTDLRLFDPQRDEPFYLQPGDLVQFVPIRD